MNTPSTTFSTTEQPPLYAIVIVPLYLPTTYTWRVPATLINKIQIGVRVEVSLRNKKYAGIVKALVTQKPSAFEPKDLLNVLDENPILYPVQLQFWQWMTTYYMCTDGEIMQAALPANLKLSSESVLVWNEAFGTNFTDLDASEYLIAEALEMRKELKLSEVYAILDTTHVYPVIKKLIDKQVCFVWEELKEKYKVKTETYILLHPTYHQEEKLSALFADQRAPKQMELLLSYLHLFKTEGYVTQQQLLQKSNATSAQLKALVDKKILISEKKSIDRIRLLAYGDIPAITLSNAQQTALEAIQNSFTQKPVCLLHGVTASGKTMVYIKLIEACRQQKKQVLYMLPEIALTAQIIRRLQVYFGNDIAIYHSKFNPNERVEIWNKVKTGQTQIVLGARSSLFLPFSNLGLIIIDEEHDNSYKQQDPAPRYHARDAAIYYASIFGAQVLLGSATPSIESYYNALQHKYGLVTLTERYGNVSLPTIELIDVKKMLSKDANKLAITPELTAAIAASLAQKKQVILFQNRRGYSPYWLCQNCGWIPQCAHCDVTLTFHKSKNKLSCHYCGTTYPVVITCAACGSHHFLQKQFGTEKIEELVAEQFPEARIARMDLDTIKGKNDHDTLIQQFEQQKIDILVGTQMVVKGLDFEHVNLVGIIDGDGILNFTDFRVNERAFQLMEQVSGRAGRKDGNGSVLIQISNVLHPVLKFVQTHHYENLYHFELEGRKNYGYPPFFRIIQLTFKHRDKTIAEQSAHMMLTELAKDFAPYLNGPAQPPVDRVRNLHIWEVLIKLPKQTSLINHCKQTIKHQIAVIQSNPLYRSVMIQPDVDPC